MTDKCIHGVPYQHATEYCRPCLSEAMGRELYTLSQLELKILATFWKLNPNATTTRPVADLVRRLIATALETGAQVETLTAQLKTAHRGITDLIDEGIGNNYTGKIHALQTENAKVRSQVETLAETLRWYEAARNVDDWDMDCGDRARRALKAAGVEP